MGTGGNVYLLWFKNFDGSFHSQDHRRENATVHCGVFAFRKYFGEELTDENHLAYTQYAF